MEIHKPKPVRDWREFLSEMSIIVLGILIALSGELLLETLHWRHQVEDTRNRLTQELFANVAAAAVRLRTAPCLEKRLDEVATLIDDAARSGKLPAIGNLSGPSVYLWGHGTWDSAVASQTTTHFPAQSLANFAVAYQFVTRLGDINQQELESWAELWMVVGPGRPFDASAAQAARMAMSHARVLDREMGIMSQGLIERFKALNLRPQMTARAALLEKQMHAPRSAYGICQPMGSDGSPRYGQAPLYDAVPSFERTLSDLPRLEE